MTVQPEDLTTVLDTEKPMSIDELTEQAIDGDARCSECGRSTIVYEKKREEVRDALRALLEQGRVTSTPEWNYRLARRADQ